MPLIEANLNLALLRPAPMSQFTPRQLPPLGPDILDYIQSDVSKDIAKLALTMIPEITENSVVHDNACGTGTVTTIIASLRRCGKLHATDLVPIYAQQVVEKAKKHGWDFVTSEAMDAQDLKVANDMFTHSFTNFCLQTVPDPARAVSEIYRTVKPGGTAVITTWRSVPQARAIEKASRTTRGRDVDMLIRWPEEYYAEEWTRGLLVDAGFSKVEIKQQVGYNVQSDLRKWCTYMWALTAKPATGWTIEDEEKWDEAIEKMVSELENDEDAEITADGGARVRMVAYIGIATK